MRLLTVFPSTERGGAEEYALTIAKAACENGWDVHAAFPYTDSTLSLVRDFRYYGIHYHPSALDEHEEHVYLISRWKRGVRFARALRCLWSMRPSVVHLVLPVPHFGFGFMLACAALNIPTAIVFQLVNCKTEFAPRILQAYHWSKARRQEWIAVSRENRRLLCGSLRLSEDEVHVIYNGASQAELDAAPVNQVRSEVRRELGLSEHERILLSVGRLVTQKGYLDLAAVIPQILREFPDVACVWVGEGGQRGELEKIIRDAGVSNQVKLLGFRRDVPRLLRAADTFVFPSHFEGHPFAISEAMSAGLPIISSDASGIPEVIHSGIHGLLYPARDRAALAETLRWALSNTDAMQRMGQNAFVRSREFSSEKMCEQTLNILYHLRMKRCIRKGPVFARA